ncbi:transposase [Bradyrhizobium sp. USDA 4354]
MLRSSLRLASRCSVARRHGLSPQQLFGWRRQSREAGASFRRRSTVCAGGGGCRSAGGCSWARAQNGALQDQGGYRGHRDRSRRHHDPGGPWCGPDDDCVDRLGAEGEPVCAVWMMVATKR